MNTKKTLFFRSFAALTVAASLAACSGSESKYEAGATNTSGQQVQPVANNANTQQTTDFTPVAPFDPAQGRQVLPVSTENNTPRKEDAASKDEDCKLNYGVMDYSRYGSEGMHFTLSLSSNAKIIRIHLVDFDSERLDQDLTLLSSNKELFDGVNKLLNNELELRDGEFDFNNPHASMQIDLRNASCGCGPKHVSQPEIITRTYTNLLEDLRLYIISKIVKNPSRNRRNTYATQPAATQPAATQPAATQPAATQPAATQPAATQPAATQPAPTQPAATQPAATQPAANADSACKDLDLTGIWQHTRRYYVNGVEVFGQAENLVTTEYKLDKAEVDLQNYSAVQSVGTAAPEGLTLAVNKQTCIALQTNSVHSTFSYKITSIKKVNDKLVIENTACSGLDCSEFKKDEQGKNITFVQTQQ